MTRQEKISNTANFCRANGFEALAKMAEGFIVIPLSDTDLDKNLNRLWEKVERQKKMEKELRTNYAHAISH